MRPGPVLARELLVASRRGALFRVRVTAVLLMLGIVGSSYWILSLSNQGRELRIQQVTGFAQGMFGVLVALQATLVLVLVPEPVARGIAGERERRTLPYLLATSLTSAEIVREKIGAGLIQYASHLALGLPVTVLLVFLGGVDPALVLLAYAGLASIAFLLAGLTAFVATGARTAREAFGLVVAVGAAWLVLPLPAAFLLPWTWSWLAAGLVPLNAWLLKSSPMGLLMIAMRAGGLSALAEAVALMIGLQVAAGTVFLLGAIVRLRPAARALEGGDASIFGYKGRSRARWHWRIWPKPPCGDDPVLWKEMHTERVDGFTKLLNVLVYLVIGGAIGYGVYWFGLPALRETIASGYGADTDTDRIMFNRFLRLITSFVTFVSALLITGTAAEAVAMEKVRDTWTSLIATPLGGRDILRAKMLGALWRVRWGYMLVAVLGVIGVIAGAVHPWGLLTALVVLAAFAALHGALGTYVSLWVTDMRHASSLTVLFLMPLTFSPLALALPVPTKTVLMAVGSAPYLQFVALASHRDVRELAVADSLASLNLLGVPIAEPPTRIALTVLLGAFGAAAGAVVFTGLAYRQFDRAIGRPRRSLTAPLRDEDLAADRLPEGAQGALEACAARAR